MLDILSRGRDIGRDRSLATATTLREQPGYASTVQRLLNKGTANSFNHSHFTREQRARVAAVLNKPTYYISSVLRLFG
jgi:hypothetical protein